MSKIEQTLSIIKPESALGASVTLEDNTISGSLTVMFSVLTVVVVPSTIKLPVTVTLFADN